MAEPATKLPVKTEMATTLARAGGKSPFETLRREIDRIFDDLHPLVRVFPSARSMIGHEVPRLRDDWQITPPIDLVESDSEYKITAELPGLDEKNVEIKLTDQVLSISGHKTEETEERNRDYHLSERSYGSFKRIFMLPKGIDTEQIEASLANGILVVRLPKTAEAQQAERTIAVKTA